MGKKGKFYWKLSNNQQGIPKREGMLFSGMIKLKLEFLKSKYVGCSPASQIARLTQKEGKRRKKEGQRKKKRLKEN